MALNDSKSNFEIPYGAGRIEISLPKDKEISVFLPNDMPSAVDQQAEIIRAMKSPINSAELSVLAEGKKTAAIVVDDSTRPVPTYLILRPVVHQLLAAGILRENITVVVATGLHRAANQEEMKEMTGDLNIKVVSHDAKSKSELVEVGTLSSGRKLLVNPIVAQSDLKILTGDIEIHQFVGYGGGAKSVLPAIVDADTIRYSHAKMEQPGTGPGKLSGNPVRSEIEEAADILGIHFMVNVVMNSKHDVVRAYAGDVHAAFNEGVKLVDEMYKVNVPAPFDVVISSPGGNPKDINLYQSQKAITSARYITKKGGKIILLAQCPEGHGSNLAFQWAQEAKTIDDIINRHRQGFCMGGHKAYQLARDISWASVYVYSAMTSEVAETFFLKPISDLAQINSLITNGDSIGILPQATLTLPILEGNV